MPTEADYQKMIKKHNWADLLHLWDQIVAGTTLSLGWGAGKAMEYLILRAFQLEGAKVSWPYSVKLDGTEIEQIDGAVHTNNLSCLIECKDLGVNVNIEPIAKLRNQLLRRPSAAIGVVFSREGFTDPALTLARFTAPQTILLWSGDEILLALKNKFMSKGLTAKYRNCVEHALPDYHIGLEV